MMLVVSHTGALRELALPNQQETATPQVLLSENLEHGRVAIHVLHSTH